MTDLRLKYVHRFRDRHGKVRYYYRRGSERIALPGDPGSKEFMDAYHKAENGQQAPKAQTDRIAPGSFDALAIAYYKRSGDFLTMRPSTQKVYQRIIEDLRKGRGARPVRLMEPRHIRTIVAQKADKPAAANNRLKVLRSMMRFAVEDGWRDDDPTMGVRKLRYRKGGFHTWTEEEIAQFEAAYPIGTKERLAQSLLLYTTCRRSDVVHLGRQHRNGDLLRIVQEKTGDEVEVPIVPELDAALVAASPDHLTYLVTEQGRPFTANGFYNWFVDRCRAAGLPKGCSPHGLRKAGATRIADAAGTPHHIMSVTGHRSLSEVETYTRKANRKALAREAVAKLRAKGEQ